MSGFLAPRTLVPAGCCRRQQTIGGAKGDDSGSPDRSNQSGGTEPNGNTYEQVAEYVSALGPTVRELSGSGAYSALGGAVTFDRGLRSLRRGETGRGLWPLAVGRLFVALAIAQRRSGKRRSGEDDTREEDYTGVVGGGSDIEEVETGSNTSREGDDLGRTVDGKDIDDTDTDDTDLVTTGVHGAPSDDQELDIDETTDERRPTAGCWWSSMSESSPSSVLEGRRLGTVFCHPIMTTSTHIGLIVQAPR